MDNEKLKLEKERMRGFVNMLKAMDTELMAHRYVVLWSKMVLPSLGIADAEMALDAALELARNAPEIAETMRKKYDAVFEDAFGRIETANEQFEKEKQELEALLKRSNGWIN